MKKVFLLVLVLAAITSANAGLDLILSDIPGLSYSIAGNTLTISGSLGVTGFLFNLQAIPVSELSNAVVYDGFVGVNSPGMWYGSAWIGASASVGTASPLTGPIFSINFAPGVWDMVFVYSSLAGAPSITIDGQAIDLTGYHLIPEPATMVLLGVGGLLLGSRRR